MNAEVKEEILDNEFSDELQLNVIVDKIDNVYFQLSRCILYWQNVEDNVLYLKNALMEKTKEHDQYHNYYGNWQNKLAIVHSRRPYEKTFVTAIWDLILAVERAFLPDDLTPDSSMRTILNEVAETAEEHGISARSFPISHLVHQLEYISWDIGANPEKVQASLISLGVPFRKLYAVYRKFNFFDDEMDGLPAHYLKSFASLIQSFIRRYNGLNMSDSDRQSVLHQCKGDVQKCLSEMYDNQDDYTPRIIQRYENLQKSLELL